MAVTGQGVARILCEHTIPKRGVLAHAFAPVPSEIAYPDNTYRGFALEEVVEAMKTDDSETSYLNLQKKLE